MARATNIDKTQISVDKQGLYLWPLRRYEGEYRRALEDPETFWAVQAHNLDWFKPWNRVLEWNLPYARWFVGGELNASHECVDRHAKSWRSGKPAIIWEGEPGDSRIITYNELYHEVNHFAAVLKKLGIGKGDRVLIYLPMIPELAISMLACARIGAVHVVTFAGFSSQSVAERINDSLAKLVITADGGYRRGKTVKLKQTVDEALKQAPSVDKVLVIKRTGDDAPWCNPRDVWFPDIKEEQDVFVAPVPLESNYPLFILYTSGVAGKPKGIQHGTGGYLTYILATYHWTLHHHEDSVCWCTADIGWITGHSYVVYAPLAHGDTILMYEGAPDYPDMGRWWQLVEKYHVEVFYTSPTAIRNCMKYGEKWPRQYDISCLEVLGSVGEPINSEVWRWYYENIGRGRCGIVDTWWQTETGGFMVAPSPGIEPLPLKPESATLPLPGVDMMVVDANGNEVPRGERGYAVIKKPWPGMLQGVYGDPELYEKTYWSRFPGYYYSGDYAIQDEDGYFWFLGRADEVIKVSGHRIAPAEIEGAAITFQGVAEAAVVGKPDPIKGDSIALFVILKEGVSPSEEIRSEIVKHIRTSIGPVATPDAIFFVRLLPKTRSGKIMRRVLRAVVTNEPLGDISTLEDETSVEEVRRAYEALSLSSDSPDAVNRS